MLQHKDRICIQKDILEDVFQTVRKDFPLWKTKLENILSEKDT